MAPLVALIVLAASTSARNVLRASDSRRTNTWRTLSDPEKQYIARPPPPRGVRDHNTSIFIGIASYRDNRCGRTLERTFAEAWDPRRVFVGVVQQNYSGTAPDWLETIGADPTFPW